MLSVEQIEDIRKRAEKYEQSLQMAKFHNEQNSQLRAVGGFPSQDWGVSPSEEHYAEDVPRLLREIEQLREELKDRETDLEFEYNSRIAAEQKLDDLKDRLSTCESELRFEQFLRHADAEAR